MAIMHACKESREAADAHDGIVVFGFRREQKRTILGKNKLVLESIETVRKGSKREKEVMEYGE